MQPSDSVWQCKMELEAICGVWYTTRVEIRNGLGIGFNGANCEGCLPHRMGLNELLVSAVLYEELTGSRGFINHFISSKVCKARLI